MGNISSEEAPLVSVLMTAYNREKYIAEAIESILASTYNNFELIIVDDCSTDKTVEIAKIFEQKDERVKVYVNEFNLGQFLNRNKAAEFAKGKYLKYFDSDDLLFPHALASIVKAMEKFPEAGAGALCLFDSYVGELPILFKSRDCYINHYFRGSNLLYVGPSGTIIKRSVFESLGKFNEKSGILADTLLMLEIAAELPIVGLEKNMFHWRIHDEQVTEGQMKIYEMIIERYLINDKILTSNSCPLNYEEVQIVRQNLKNILIRNLPKIIFKISIKKTLSIIRVANLNISDLFKVFIPNKKLLQ